jgi:hypothetical protein
LESQLGRYNLGQTVVKEPEKLPCHVLADAKVTWLHGEEVGVATTVGDDGLLGASVALGADTANVTQASQHFKGEALHRNPDYLPETVTTDGWEATQQAWRNRFPLMVISACFLHTVITIRERGKHRKATFRQRSQKVWDVSRAGDADTFRANAAAFLAWAETNTTGAVLEAVRKRSSKGDRLVLANTHPRAHRTSPMLDRHMQAMARWRDSSRFFHGHWTAAERSIRAWALLYDFGPYVREPVSAKPLFDRHIRSTVLSPMRTGCTMC